VLEVMMEVVDDDIEVDFDGLESVELGKEEEVGVDALVEEVVIEDEVEVEVEVGEVIDEEVV
jgi:hypothetical protein